MHIRELRKLLQGWSQARQFFSQQNIDCFYLALQGVRRDHGAALTLGAALTVSAVLLLLLGSGSSAFSRLPAGLLPRSAFISLPANLETLSQDQFPSGASTRFPQSARSVFAGETRPGDGRGDGICLPAGNAAPGHDFDRHAQSRGLPEVLSPIRFSDGQVQVVMAEDSVFLTGLRHASLPGRTEATDIFLADMFAAAGEDDDLPPLLYGEDTDDTGAPKRWSRPENAVADSDLLACSLELGPLDFARSLVRGAGLPFVGTNFSTHAGRYRNYVRRYAEKYDLAASLVLAIMHTESNFNPLAVSRSRAVGLMQIVPHTAGNEVYEYLTGSQGSPSRATLFSPEHNIQYGTAYLHLLKWRYFGGVRNAASRQMCVVAAYNGGPGAVLRVFDSDMDEAVRKINSLSPEALYATLTSQLPSAETRQYVAKVLGRMRHYAAK